MIRSIVLLSLPFAVASGVAATPTAADVGDLLATYYVVQKSLAVDDLAAAKNAAITLQQQALKVGASRKLTDAAGLVGKAAGLKIARTRFHPVSTELLKLVESIGTGGKVVYVAVCPMAFDRSGTWLQDSEIIANPYFGTLMPRCGRVTKQLGAGTEADHAMN